MSTREERKSKEIFGKWKGNAMQLAIKAVRENKKGFLKASKEFNVPKTTLRRHFYDQNKIVKNEENTLVELLTSLKFLKNNLVITYFKWKQDFMGLLWQI